MSEDFYKDLYKRWLKWAMKHDVHVLRVRPLENYSVSVTFSDGNNFRVDLSYVLDMFPELREKAHFNQVYVEGDTIAWPGEDDSYDVSQYVLYARARLQAERSIRKEGEPVGMNTVNTLGTKAN